MILLVIAPDHPKGMHPLSYMIQVFQIVCTNEACNPSYEVCPQKCVVLCNLQARKICYHIYYYSTKFFFQTPSNKKIEMTTTGSTYHIEVNPR